MTYAQIAKQKQEIMGALSGLVKELQTLAPHPDQPNYTGPLFLHRNDNFKAANDHDGMLGSMILENMLGSAFAQAAADATHGISDHIDLSNAMEAYSTYISDVEGAAQHKAAHGQGTFARMSGTSISQGFNLRSTISAPMQAFYDDLPKRMMIEKSLAYYARQLAQLDAPAYAQKAPHPVSAA